MQSAILVNQCLFTHSYPGNTSHELISTDIEFMEDLDEFLEMKAGVKEGKIKQRKRNLSEGSEENEEPPNKVKKRTRLDFINFSLMLFCVYWLYVVFLTFYILCLNSLFFFLS